MDLSTLTTVKQVMEAYTQGMIDMDEANQRLDELDSTIFLKDTFDGKLTDEEIDNAVVSNNPAKVTGYGLMYMGIGGPIKLYVENGSLGPDNWIGPNMYATFLIGGRWYGIDDDHLVDYEPYVAAHKAEMEANKKPKLPSTPDMSRRTDLAGQVVRQQVKSGYFDVYYNDLGYAVKATRVIEEEDK